MKKNIDDQNEDELEFENDQEDDEDLDDEDEDEEDQDDDQDDDDDDEPAPRSNKVTKQLADVKATLAELKALSAKGDGSDKRKVKKVDEIFSVWLSNGEKKETLAPLYELMQGLKDDLKGEYEEARSSENAKTLQDRSWEAMDSAFDKVARKMPQVSWSKAEITARAFELMSKGKAYADARETYSRGKVPAARHYENALLKIVSVFEKETGKSSGAKKEAPQTLDLKNSRTKGKSSAVGEGDVDVSKLDAMERQIYTTTLNITKDKKLAKEALQDLRGKL